MSRLKISYDATGRKLRYDNTDYVGPFVYESGVLRYIITGEGRAIPNGSSYKYEYHIKDHLGNVRVAFMGNNGMPAVIQKNDYYPFGLLMQERTDNASNKNKYLYNGKEFLPDNDLSWYDYGARMYDPQLGRWHTPDAYSEIYDNESPYCYGGNNPISFMDPDGNFKTRFGAWLWKVFNGGGEVMQDKKGGEYFVAQQVPNKGDADITIKRTFDWENRSEGKDLELEAQREFLLQQFEFKREMESMGIEAVYTDSRIEALVGMLQIPAMVVMPNVLKSSTGVVNTAKQGGRIKANSLIELKRLIQELSTPGSELTEKELKQLTKLVEKYGGKIRKDLNPSKGNIRKPHVQVEGLGKSVESRHIWLKNGVN